MNTGSYLSKKGYVLRKEHLTADELHVLKQELRGRPLIDDKYNQFNKQDMTFPLYIETRNKMYIPKMYGLSKYGQATSEMQNYKGKPWDMPLRFTGTLYSHQIEPCEKMLQVLQSKRGGILALPTGFGKSISAIYVLSQLRGKAMIIVNKISLLKQWEKEIQTFLPECRVGFIQGQKNVDVHDKHIIIAMLQSLAKNDYPDALFEDINVTLVDEIHNVSSPVFSKVLMKVCSQYTIGLSATPNRSDGCEYVFKWFIGDIIYQTTMQRKGLPPIVHTIKISTDDYKEIATENRFTGMKQIQFSTMLNELTQMRKRNLLIVAMLKDLVTRENRKVLVMSDRRTHLKELKNLLDIDHDATFTCGLFLGSMKMSELEKSKACQVILATYQAFGEGVSEKDLDTLILGTPKKFIGHLKNTTKQESGKLEQIVGRIFRKEHTVKAPMIVDLHDNFSVYKAQSKQRMAFYKEHFSVVTMIESSVDLSKYPESEITRDCVITKQAAPETNNNATLYNTCMMD